MVDNPKKILITGASGFLGGAIARSFAARSEYNVIGTSRRDIGQLVGYDVKYVPGDLCDKYLCDVLTRDVDHVVHCAALSSLWGNYADFERANVVTTSNLLDAAIKNKVQRFIFVSTPSIYFNYTDRYDISEAEPLPPKMVNWYAHTKLIAEQHVLGKCNKGIETLALRPRAIIGAGDTTIFPRLLKAHTDNKLRIIGGGQNICDLTCVNNVIHATELAMRAGSDALGLAYNITNGSPVKLWEIINYVFSELGYPALNKKVPVSLAAGYASFLEWKYKMFNRDTEPPLTRFGIGVLGNSLTMNISRAEKLLHYLPVQSTQEGVDEFIAWFKSQRK
jgi:nucleoside-diphosphate-sugar epimerase